MEPLVTVGKENGPHAEALVVATGEKGGAGAGTDGAADIEVVETHAFLRHPVEVRRLGDGRAVEADVAIPHVVDEDEDDVGLLRRGMERGAEGAEEEERKGESIHSMRGSGR